MVLFWVLVVERFEFCYAGVLFGRLLLFAVFFTLLCLIDCVGWWLC